MNYSDIAKAVFSIEAKSVADLSDKLSHDFDGAIAGVLASSGKTIVCGMGKSGIIGKKIAATLASTALHLFLCTQVKRTTVI